MLSEISEISDWLVDSGIIKKDEVKGFFTYTKIKCIFSVCTGTKNGNKNTMSLTLIFTFWNKTLIFTVYTL